MRLVSYKSNVVCEPHFDENFGCFHLGQARFPSVEGFARTVTNADAIVGCQTAGPGKTGNGPPTVTPRWVQFVTSQGG